MADGQTGINSWTPVRGQAPLAKIYVVVGLTGILTQDLSWLAKQLKPPLALRLEITIRTRSIAVSTNFHFEPFAVRIADCRQGLYHKALLNNIALRQTRNPHVVL